MKKLLFLLFFTTAWELSFGQVNIIDLSSGIKKVGSEYSDDFKKMRGKLKTTENGILVYYSRFKIPGSIDSTNLIYQDKINKTWYFKAELDRQTIVISELISIVPQILFSFGSLKGIPSGFEWITVFVPANKRKASDRVRNFNVLIYDGMRNPTDAKGQLLYIRIGGDMAYREN